MRQMILKSTGFDSLPVRATFEGLPFPGMQSLRLADVSLRLVPISRRKNCKVIPALTELPFTASGSRVVKVSNLADGSNQSLSTFVFLISWLTKFNWRNRGYRKQIKLICGTTWTWNYQGLISVLNKRTDPEGTSGKNMLLVCQWDVEDKYY